MAENLRTLFEVARAPRQSPSRHVDAHASRRGRPGPTRHAEPHCGRPRAAFARPDRRRRPLVGNEPGREMERDGRSCPPEIRAMPSTAPFPSFPILPPCEGQNLYLRDELRSLVRRFAFPNRGPPARRANHPPQFNLNLRQTLKSRTGRDRLAIAHARRKPKIVPCGQIDWQND